MYMTHPVEALLNILKSDPRFVAEDGSILKNVVFDAIYHNDPELIKAIQKDPELHERYFTVVSPGIEVFNQTEFGWLVNNKQFLPDSYTRFANKIGLADDRPGMISQRNEVVIEFPYKDCVLEGNQSKTDSKRNEIFYNKTLSPDKVDTLLAPKVLTNAVKFTKDGSVEVDGFNNDNLIIRGNNLLALSSILKRYENKVRCIYIDPPYYFSANKSEDTFLYNSNFKLSTWLVFMKNRLELAKRLLSDDGAIFVQISDDGVAELHILMKEVFGTSNFINKITVKTRSPSGFASVNPGVFESAEYILAFAKDKKQWRFKTLYVESEYDENYKWVIQNVKMPFEYWEIESITDVVAKEQGFPDKKAAVKKLGNVVFDQLVSQYALEHPDNVFRYTQINDNASAETVKARDFTKENKDQTVKIPRENHYSIYVRNGQEITFYSKKVREVDGRRVPSIQLSNIWIDTPYEGIAKEGSVSLSGGKKPEKLVKRIIEMSTEPGDIVLDFFLGSGTTCAVAHKMGRRYVGIEQLNYGDNDCLKRLKTVIDGDSSGISKAVNWTGGGSFVYCELMKLNQIFVERLSVVSESDILELYKDVVYSPYINTGIVPSQIEDSMKDFEDLSFDKKKEAIINILDANMLYVNLSDMDDPDYAVSDSMKAFNRSFYG